jgi:2-oxoacid dehydrogenase-like protein with E3 subunit-binding domain
MAEKTTKSQRSGKRRGQSASSRKAKGNAGGANGKRPALEARRTSNDADREYRRYIQREEQDPAGPPDVLLDVPELKVDLIHFELDDLDAHVALKARVLNLVKLNVGLDVHLSRVKLDVKGVEAEVVLKARLDHVTAIVDRLMTTLDRNPELVKGLSRAVSEVGQGAGDAVDKTGDAAKDVGRGAQSALREVGKGAGDATGDIGEGAGQAVGDVGQGAGQAVGDVGQGAGQAVGNLDQVVGGVGQTLGQGGQGAGQALGGLGQGAGQAGQGATQALGGLGQAAGHSDGQAQARPESQGQNGGGPAAATPGALAKETAKMVAREIGHAASDEARDLGLAATRKVRELGERREQRRAGKYHATEAAIRTADELGVDLARLEGTGSEGRITVKDVRGAQEA